MNLREIELTHRIVLLEKQLADCEPEAWMGGQKSKRFDTRCYNCGKLGHIAKDCKRGQGQSDNPNTSSKSKRSRQANSREKLYRTRCRGF